MSRTPAVVASVPVDVHAESAAESVPESVLPDDELLATHASEAPGADPSLDLEPDLEPDLGARPPSELSDQELLDGIRLQSEVHFAELYNRYFQRIYNFVYGRMRNHAETEEVVQETFLAVFRSFGNYRGQSSLLSWIYGIAKNTANNTIRRSKSQNERIDLADDEDLMPLPSLGGAAPDEQLDLHRFQDTLSHRLEGLADWQLEIFEMRHFENLSIPEISERTSRSSDAVRSSLYRVKKMFFEAANATSSLQGPPSRGEEGRGEEGRDEEDSDDEIGGESR